MAVDDAHNAVGAVLRDCLISQVEVVVASAKEREGTDFSEDE